MAIAPARGPFGGSARRRTQGQPHRRKRLSLDILRDTLDCAARGRGRGRAGVIEDYAETEKGDAAPQRNLIAFDILTSSSRSG
jgi:hypothetical protein